MSTVPPPPPPAPGGPYGDGEPAHRRPGPWSSKGDRGLLERLAELLADGHHGHGVVFVGLSRASPHAVDVHLRPLHQRDPVEELAGWRAPASWFGVGCTAPAVVDRPGAPGEPAALAVLAGRDGTIAVGVAGEATRAPWATTVPGTVGRAADVCLRALSLPTSPCREPPAVAWATLWLDRLVERVATGPRRARHQPALTWADVAAVHPFVDALAPNDRGPTALGRLAGHPLAGASWETLRRAAAEGRLPAWPVPTALAEWLDAGSFGRHLVGGLPAAADLWAALGDLLPPRHRREVRSVAQAWGLRLGPPPCPGGPVATVSP